MQEFITLPTSILSEMLDNKIYSKADALLDLLSMADENGEVHCAIRSMMNRWGWSNTKVVSFMSVLEEKDILTTQKRQKKDTIYRINTGFVGIAKDTKTTQKRQKKDTATEEVSLSIRSKNTDGRTIMNPNDAYQMIADTWNTLADYGIKPVYAEDMIDIQKDSIATLARKYTVSDILNTIERIKNSDFLQGKKVSWKINFGWFLEQKNYEKVRDGRYDNTEYIEGKITRGVYKTYDAADSWLVNRKENKDDRPRICNNSKSD